MATSSPNARPARWTASARSSRASSAPATDGPKPPSSALSTERPRSPSTSAVADRPAATVSIASRYGRPRPARRGSPGSEPALGVEAAAQDVHHRQRSDAAPPLASRRQSGVPRRRLRRGRTAGDGEQRVRAEPRPSACRRARSGARRARPARARSCRESPGRLSPRTLDRFEHAAARGTAADRRRGALRFVAADRCAGGNARACNRAVVESELDLDGRAPAGVEDLACVHRAIVGVALLMERPPAAPLRVPRERGRRTEDQLRAGGSGAVALGGERYSAGNCRRPGRPSGSRRARGRSGSSGRRPAGTAAQ